MQEYEGLCQFTIHDPSIHDPTMPDSRINYANRDYIEIIHDITERKKYKRDMQGPGFLGEENKRDQRSFLF